jgi:hypothetical protein
MKNIIATIALFLTAVVAQAQVVVKYNKHYHFSHDTGISTYEAFKNNLETNMGSYSSNTTWTFDTAYMVFNMVSGSNIKHNGYILNFDRINNKYGGVDYVFLVRTTNSNVTVSVSIFQNTKTERLLMTKARDKSHPDKYFGHQGVIID